MDEIQADWSILRHVCPRQSGFNQPQATDDLSTGYLDSWATYPCTSCVDKIYHAPKQTL